MICLTALVAPPAMAEVDIDPDLLRLLHTDEAATLLVYLESRADFQGVDRLGWIERGRLVHQRLVITAQRSQRDLRAYLDEAGIAYRAFWIANVVVIEGADLEILNRLRSISGVRAIKGESGSRLMGWSPPSNSARRAARRAGEITTVPHESRRGTGVTTALRAPAPGPGQRLTSPSLAPAPRLGQYLTSPSLAPAPGPGQRLTSPPLAPPGAGGGREGVRGAVPTASIVHIGVPQVWDLGYFGDGITIGVIDSGVRHTHEALVEQYRGHEDGELQHDFNWFDPQQYSDEPRYADAHGTHVTGTAVGGSAGQAIGVAPDARWMACMGCPGSLCPDSTLLACAEFMLAPTTTDGADANPDLRPHIINNSWGDCAAQYNDWFQAAVDAWLAAGMLPVFAAGNAQSCQYPRPPGLNTVGNPARYGTVLGVGSTGTSDGEYANHSNWGPTDDPNPGLPDYPDHQGYPHVKPNVMAPGVNILSAVSSADDAYQSGWTGTSMSAPHVTGLAALMWQAAPCLIGDFVQTAGILMRSARPIDYDSHGQPSPGPGNHPNYATGWGEIDALAAVQAAIQRCTPGFDLAVQPASIDLCAGEAAVFELSLTPRLGFDDAVLLSVAGLPSEVVAVFDQNPVHPGPPSTPVSLSLHGTDSIPPGSYALTFSGQSATGGLPRAEDTATAVLSVVSTSPAAVAGQVPGAGARLQSLQPDLLWHTQPDAATYRVQLADNRDFHDPLIDQVVSDTTLVLPEILVPSTVYYWRVTAINACGHGDAGRVFRFTTRPLHGECPLGTEELVVFNETFADGLLPDGWSTQNTTGAGGWIVTDARSVSGTHSMHAAGMDGVSDQQLISPSIPLPAQADSIVLNFENWQAIEAGGAACFDGAVVEVSADGGHWRQPGAHEVLTRPWDAVVAPDFLNPLAGLPAWCGDPRDAWERYSIELVRDRGRWVRLRFRLGSDNSIAREGWYVDAIQVKACLPIFRDRYQPALQ